MAALTLVKTLVSSVERPLQSSRGGAARLFGSVALVLVFLCTLSFAHAQLYWPATGDTGSPIGQRQISNGSSNHRGLDIPLPNGTTVYAAQGGTIEFHQQDASNGKWGAGYYAVIDHGNGYQTRYFHLTEESRMVPNGSTVAAGQPIALSGTSGQPPGADPSYHLHFEVRKDGNFIDWDNGISRGTSVSQGEVIPYTFAGMDGGAISTDPNVSNASYTIQKCKNRSGDEKICRDGGYNGNYTIDIGSPITLTQEEVNNAATLCTDFSEVIECDTANPPEGYTPLDTIDFVPDPSGLTRRAGHKKMLRAGLYR